MQGYGRTFPHPFGKTDSNLFNTLIFVSPVGKNVGLDRTLIVLSADRGMAEMPEFMAEKGMHTGRITNEDVIRAANDSASRKFGINGVVKNFFRPYLYLKDDVILDAGKDPSVVEQGMVKALTEVDGIALAAASSTLGTMPDTPLLRQIRNNSHPSRSGHIYVVQEPYWFLFEKGPIAVMHGSPWRYDTYVPTFLRVPASPRKRSIEWFIRLMLRRRFRLISELSRPRRRSGHPCVRYSAS